MKKGKKAPWRLVVGFLAAVWIIYMWSTKDLAAQYAALPREQALPLIVTTVAVSAVKVIVIAAAVWLLRWLVAKLNKK